MCRSSRTQPEASLRCIVPLDNPGQDVPRSKVSTLFPNVGVILQAIPGFQSENCSTPAKAPDPPFEHWRAGWGQGLLILEP